MCHYAFKVKHMHWDTKMAHWDTKMAPRMVDTVVRSLVLFMFLFICTVFSNPSTITFSREELMNVRHSFPQTLSPDFTDPETFLEILVGGAAALCGAWRRRRRGKRAGALVGLREQGFYFYGKFKLNYSLYLWLTFELFKD